MTSNRTGALALVCGLAAAAVGCDPGVADVSGTVTHKGKPVASGTVTAVGADGTPRVVTISPDGTYSVTGVQAGEVRFAVLSPNPVEAAQPRNRAQGDRGQAGRRGGGDAERAPQEATPVVDPAVAKKWFPIPPDAGDVLKSGLKMTAVKGPNKFDLTIP